MNGYLGVSTERVMLTCPNCKHEHEWTGYPRIPRLSMVLCLHCGWAQPGAAFKPRIEM